MRPSSAAPLVQPAIAIVPTGSTFNFYALTSVTSDALPVGSIQLADKGDGTPASKAERKN